MLWFWLWAPRRRACPAWSVAEACRHEHAHLPSLPAQHRHHPSRWRAPLRALLPLPGTAHTLCACASCGASSAAHPSHGRASQRLVGTGSSCQRSSVCATPGSRCSRGQEAGIAEHYPSAGGSTACAAAAAAHLYAAQHRRAQMCGRGRHSTRWQVQAALYRRPAAG